MGRWERADAGAGGARRRRDDDDDDADAGDDPARVAAPPELHLQGVQTEAEASEVRGEG